MRQRERDYSPYAAILGITGQPDAAQRKAANRAKHRVYIAAVRLMRQA
jgi:hypothetical protein